MKFREYRLQSNYKNIYYFLKDNGFSENFITNLRKNEGSLIVNGKIANTKTPLEKDDLLEINPSPNAKTTIMHCILPLDIVYEDEYYLLINKPSNLSSMPNKSHYSSNLAGAICYYFKDKEDFVLRMINRLDKDTSGLILIAKDSISQKDVKNIKKTYYALCEGKIDNDTTINKKIETITNNGINDKKRIISNNGKEATTFVHPMRSNEKASLVSLQLEYGRTHQIRVHLSSIGHPLIGDELYGQKSDLIDHTALVCGEFSFFHPYLKRQLDFKIAFPEDFVKCMDSLLTQDS